MKNYSKTLTNVNIVRGILAILVGLLLLGAALFGTAASAKKTTTTTSKPSTTKSTTTKVGKSKFSDLVLLKQSDGLYYASNKKTKAKTDYTGIVPKGDGTWWFCRKGKLDRSFTGVAENPFGMWVVQKGKVNLNYAGYYIKNGMEIYRVDDGAVNPYTTVMDLGIKDGLYPDGSETANDIMNITEPLFQQNISNAAEQGIVRTKGLTKFKKALIWIVFLLFADYLGIRKYLEVKKKREEKEPEEEE